MKPTMQQSVKVMGTTLLTEMGAGKEPTTGAQHAPGGLARGVVISGDVTNGYTVAVAKADGTASDRQFERVNCFPTDQTLGAGDSVMLLFEAPEHPVIMATGAGGGTADFVVVGEMWFTG